MGKLFDMNNPVWTFIGKLVDVFILHFVWLVCSLPIVTIGASTAALYYALMKDAADEETHYVRAFFRSFKLNLKQGIGIGLIMLLVGGLLVFSLWFYSANGAVLFNGKDTVPTILKGLTIMFLILYVFVFHYIFAVFARFDNTTKVLFQNAFFLSIRNIGWTLLMILVTAAFLGVLLLLGFVPILLFGFPLCVYIDAYMLNHIFEPFIKQMTGEDGDKNPDEWVIPEEEETALSADEGDVPALTDGETAAEDAGTPDGEETAEGEDAEDGNN